MDNISEISECAAGDDRPTEHEAWALALRALDESNTVVWTDDMAQAFSIARPILSLGDYVGARLAFTAAYGRIVSAARSSGIGAVWSASLGHDKYGRNGLMAAALDGPADVDQRRAARRVLDAAVDGADVSEIRISDALRITGDLQGESEQ